MEKHRNTLKRNQWGLSLYQYETFYITLSKQYSTDKWLEQNGTYGNKTGTTEIFLHNKVAFKIRSSGDTAYKVIRSW